MPAPGVHISPTGKKTFIPLENNPEVFTALIHDLGLSPDLAFFDIYSLAEPALLSHIPRPVLALIFITPSPPYHAVRHAEQTPLVKEHGLTYNKTGKDEPAMWFLQTIGHSCGLIALLHAAASPPVRRYVQPGSTLDTLLREAEPLDPQQRADLLYDSEALEAAHMRAAKTGDSRAPGADEPCGPHFLAFVRGEDGRLWEQEGSSDGPIVLGAMGEGEDMLSERVVELGVGRFIKAADGDVGFSVIALAKKTGEDGDLVG